MNGSSARGLAQRAPGPLCEIAVTGLGDLSLSVPPLRELQELRDDFLESAPRGEAMLNSTVESCTPTGGATPTLLRL